MNLNSLEAYDFYLPKTLIAQDPVDPRDHSKLMVLNQDKIIHDYFYNIINYLEKDDLIIFNDTKVLKARMIGKKLTGGKVEALITSKKDNVCTAIIGGKNVRIGTILDFNGLRGKVIEKNEGFGTIEFEQEPDLDNVATVKLPPYIKKELKDADRYQTIFAKNNGSLAAPTAGLHFTSQLLKNLEYKGVKIGYITLHIGFSTFAPVREEDITTHKMYYEYYSISNDTADLINNRSGRLIAVGTTVMRALESSAKDGKIMSNTTKTDLFIYPGYKFKSGVAALITNFHIPKSSLLMLVSAFAGYENIMRAYRIAVENKYRFFSFGDAMLVFPYLPKND
ncbi:MAG: tRNA preQ1(34) S-adenosylmethionine ribosyltransferase-isomerase QueA [Thermoplasmata archaeon]